MEGRHLPVHGFKCAWKGTPTLVRRIHCFLLSKVMLCILGHGPKCLHFTLLTSARVVLGWNQHEAQFKWALRQSMNNATPTNLSSVQNASTSISRMSVCVVQFITGGFGLVGGLNSYWDKHVTDKQEHSSHRRSLEPATPTPLKNKTLNFSILGVKVATLVWWHNGLTKWTNPRFEQLDQMKFLFQSIIFDNFLV